jgi:UDP-N-acetylmuramoyl-tripeptide--D-alanyl-D-alanine ligase
MGIKSVTLGEIAGAVHGEYLGGASQSGQAITGVVRDHHDVFAGCLFVCIRGERADGHDYIRMAARMGALCALVERIPDGADGLASPLPYILVNSTHSALLALGAYYRNLFDIPIVAVTGSVGKTTVKEMTAAVLGARYRVHKTPLNLNNEIGVPLTLLSMRNEDTAAVIEMGISDFGEMDRLAAAARPTICIVTSIGRCHLETLGDLRGVLRAKSEVFAHMPGDGVAVVNGDDPLLQAFDPGIRKVTYGLGPRNDYRAENIKTCGKHAVSCDIVSDSGRFSTEIPAFGLHVARAAAAASAVAGLLGLDSESTVLGISSYKPVAGRANIIETGYITVIDDCYNANPDSVSESLRSLCSLEGRRVAILGDMEELGYKSEDMHREIGGYAAQLGVDCLICCGKKAEFIYKGHIAGGGGAESYHFPFKDSLLPLLPGLIRRDDTVLVKASHSHKFEEITERLYEMNAAPA